jgi:hypothetical protein
MADDGGGFSTDTATLSTVTGLGHRLAHHRAVLSLFNFGIGGVVPLRTGWRMERSRLFGDSRFLSATSN